MKLETLQDKTAESGIIATLIEHPDFYFQCDYLTPHHFYNEETGYLYYALSEIAMSKIEKVDSYNIINMLNKREDVKKAAKDITIERLNELIDLASCTNRDTVAEYQALVDNVIAMYSRRNAYMKVKECERVIEKDFSGDYRCKIYDIIDKGLLDDVKDNTISLFGESVDDLWNDILERTEKGGYCGLPSKFDEVNEYFTYEPEELVVIAAARKEGKSMILLNEVLDKLKRGHKCVYFDTELSNRQHFERLLACLTGIEVKTIKGGLYTEEQKTKIIQAKEWIKKKPYVHIYMTTPNMNEVYRIVKKLQKRMGVDFVVYDYIKSQDSNSSTEIYNMLGDICNTLKNKIAGELKLSVVAAAQLNRGGEIADSYKIEQFASAIAVLKRKSKEEYIRDGKECGNYKFHIKLNRIGEQMTDFDTEYVDLQFNGNLASFKQATQHKTIEPF